MEKGSRNIVDEVAMVSIAPQLPPVTEAGVDVGKREEEEADIEHKRSGSLEEGELKKEEQQDESKLLTGRKLALAFTGQLLR